MDGARLRLVPSKLGAPCVLLGVCAHELSLFYDYVFYRRFHFFGIRSWI